MVRVVDTGRIVTVRNEMAEMALEERSKGRFGSAGCIQIYAHLEMCGTQ